MLLRILNAFKSIYWLFVFLEGELPRNRKGAAGGKKERNWEPAMIKLAMQRTEKETHHFFHN